MAHRTRSAVASALSGVANRFGNLFLGLEQRQRAEAAAAQQAAEGEAEREALADYRAAQLAQGRARTQATLANAGFRPAGAATPDLFGFRFQAPGARAPAIGLGRMPAAGGAGAFSRSVFGEAPDLTPDPGAERLAGAFTGAVEGALAGGGTPGVVFDGQRWRYVGDRRAAGFDPATDVPVQREMYYRKTGTGPYRPGSTTGRTALTMDQALDQVYRMYKTFDDEGYEVLPPPELARAAADSLRTGGRLPPLPGAAPADAVPAPSPLERAAGAAGSEEPGAVQRLMGDIGRRIAGLFGGDETTAVPQAAFDRRDPRNAKLLEVLNDPEFTTEEKRTLVRELFSARTVGPSR